MQTRVLKVDSRDNVLIPLTGISADPAIGHTADLLAALGGRTILSESPESGEATIEQMGETILEYVIQVASGEAHPKAELKGQADFIPWKRGVSL